MEPLSILSQLDQSKFIYKMVPNIHVESTSGPQLAVDEVEKIQRQKIASLIGHVFQVTYV